MHAATLRRLILFGVCAVGVSSLYLLPGVARAPHQAPGRGDVDEPNVRPSGSTVRDASSPVRDRAEASASPDVADPTVVSEQRADEPSRPQASAADAPHHRATASDPAGPADEQSPVAVSDLTSTAVTPSRLSLSWPAASDNVGVVGYTVMLDGFEVATTAKTSATVRWFNDDAREHIVQVRALDAAGNLSDSSPNLLITRPTPAPDPTSKPSTPSPEPTPIPEPGSTPSPSLSIPSAPSAAPLASASTEAR